MLSKENTLNLKNYFAFDKRVYFLFLCVAAASLQLAVQILLVNDDLYYQALGEQMSYNRIEELLNLQHQWNWLNYVSIPFVYLIKIFLITVCLFTGAVLLDLKVSFKKLFQLSVLAETIFLAPIVLTIVWFSWIQPDYSLNDLQTFYPLSLLNIINPENLSSWMIYPLRLINLFEVAYIFLLGYGISIVTQQRFGNGLTFVLSTYCVGLVMWAVFIAFIMINLS